MAYNIYKEVIKSNVNPALWCTEPVSVAYATSALKEYAPDSTSIEKISIKVNGELYKNALGVFVPNSGWQKWLEIAAALWIIGWDYSKKLEVLEWIQKEDREKAKQLVDERRIHVEIDKTKKDLFIEATVRLKDGKTFMSLMENSYMNLMNTVWDGEKAITNIQYDDTLADGHYYENLLKASSIEELMKMASQIDEEDITYIKEWIEMNMDMAEKSWESAGVWSTLEKLSKKWLLPDDIISKIKILTAKATDARMAWVNMPVMSSGGSGNQWIVSILVPYIYGKNVPLDSGELVDERIIYESIAFSHLLNSYVKCFTGKLSAMCGCAIAAWLWATGAITYQRTNKDKEIVADAINNLISEIAGILCDWAKLWCATKMNTAVECSIVASLKAIEWCHVTSDDGIIWKTAEESIKNLWKVAKIGMSSMNTLLLQVLNKKK